MRVGFAKVMTALDPPSLSVRTSGEDRVEAPCVETGARMHVQGRAHAPSTYGACEADSQHECAHQHYNCGMLRWNLLQVDAPARADSEHGSGDDDTLLEPLPRRRFCLAQVPLLGRGRGSAALLGGGSAARDRRHCGLPAAVAPLPRPLTPTCSLGRHTTHTVWRALVRTAARPPFRPALNVRASGCARRAARVGPRAWAGPAARAARAPCARSLETPGARALALPAPSAAAVRSLVASGTEPTWHVAPMGCCARSVERARARPRAWVHNGIMRHSQK